MRWENDGDKVRIGRVVPNSLGHRADLLENDVVLTVNLKAAPAPVNSGDLPNAMLSVSQTYRIGPIQFVLENVSQALDCMGPIIIEVARKFNVRSSSDWEVHSDAHSDHTFDVQAQGTSQVVTGQGQSSRPPNNEPSEPEVQEAISAVSQVRRKALSQRGRRRQFQSMIHPSASLTNQPRNHRHHQSSLLRFPRSNYPRRLPNLLPNSIHMAASAIQAFQLKRAQVRAR